MFSSSMRAAVFRRRNITLFFCAAACLYFLISVMSSYMTVKQLSQPSYTFVHTMDNLESSTTHLPSTDSIGVPTNVSNMIFLPSFFALSKTTEKLLQNDEYFSRILSLDSSAQYIWSNHTNFHCICGRVSDTCVCCGELQTPEKSPLLGKPLILFASDDSDSATFCVNMTYLPKKQEVKLTGFLTHFAEPNPPNSPKISSAQPIHLSYNISKVLILYDSQFVPLISPPSICAENSKEEPHLMLCAQLSNLRYGVDSVINHQTFFAGCLKVYILVQRRWTIISYPAVCFRAHRGAAGDVDQASVVAKPSEVHKDVTRLENVSAVTEAKDNADLSKGDENRRVTKTEESQANVPLPINAVHPGIL